MKHFSRNTIDELDHLFRINLINSCSGYKSANLIGTQSREGISNLAIFSSVIHMGSNPPLLGFVLRPTKVARHTYTNIKDSAYYTINHVPFSIAEEAHHTSAKYGEEVSEFDMTGLQEEIKNGFYAPFVSGAPVQMGMKFIEEHFIKSNETLLIIGEIKDLFINSELLEEDGYVNLSKGEIATISGLDGYSLPVQTKRFGYQRPRELNDPVTTREKGWSKF